MGWIPGLALVGDSLGTWSFWKSLSVLITEPYRIAGLSYVGDDRRTDLLESVLHSGDRHPSFVVHRGLVGYCWALGLFCCIALLMGNVM